MRTYPCLVILILVAGVGCASAGRQARLPDGVDPIDPNAGYVVVADVAHAGSFEYGYYYAFRVRAELQTPPEDLRFEYRRFRSVDGLWATFVAPPTEIVTAEDGLGWSRTPAPMVLSFAPPLDPEGGPPTVDPAPGTGLGTFMAAGVTTADGLWLGLQGFQRLDAALADQHWPVRTELSADERRALQPPRELPGQPCPEPAECPVDVCTCDADGRRVGWWDFDERQLGTWTWEGEHKVAEEIDRGGDGDVDSRTTWTYDEQGRLVEEDGVLRIVNTWDGEQLASEEIWSAAGKLYTRTHYEQGLLMMVEDVAHGGVTLYTYDEAGNRIAMEERGSIDQDPYRSETYDPPCPPPFADRCRDHEVGE